ncbi:MAG: glycosyltransferase family 4 protein, partial [Lentisphaerae bacterium]|nr:glycosyltransferase family 4 protein [Lentisphaerota bacterium]
LLLVSAYEGTSVGMLDAMAHGCVPIVTAVSGTREVIEPGTNGFLVPPDETIRMVQPIARLAGDRDLLARIGAAARLTIEQRYGWEDYVDWWQELVQEAWRKPAPTWPARHRVVPRAWHYCYNPLWRRVGRRFLKWAHKSTVPSC